MYCRPATTVPDCYPNFYTNKLERMEAGTAEPSVEAPSTSVTAAIADEEVLDTWVLGLRVIAAAAALLTSIAVILKIELFEDHNTSQLFVSGTGFGVALITYLLALWRAKRLSQPSTEFVSFFRTCFFPFNLAPTT